MKPEQQRIAIAKAHGYRRNGGTFPDYLNDLNVLAAARDQLINTLELRIKWVNTLRTAVGKTAINRNKLGSPIVSDIDLLFAKPEQLAETLLRTLNLWKS